MPNNGSSVIIKDKLNSSVFTEEKQTTTTTNNKNKQQATKPGIYGVKNFIMLQKIMKRDSMPAIS